MSTEVRELERSVLQAIVDRDRADLERLLTDDFVITTAGWIRTPATRTEWLDGIAAHALREFEILAVDERPVSDATVALVLSRQTGELGGQNFDYSFRYTDVWVKGVGGGLRLAVRHASIVPDQPH